MDDSTGLNQFDQGVFRQMPITELLSHTHTQTETQPQPQPQSQPQTLSSERDPDTKTGQRYNQWTSSRKTEV